MEWINPEIKKPLVYKSGNWDGLCSDKVLIKTEDGEKQVADLNEGVLDGWEFSEWYDYKGFEVGKKVIGWMEIPE